MTLESACISRPLLGQTICGDGCSLIDADSALLVTVVDGLGHGSGAADASQPFLEFVAANRDLPLDRLMSDGGKHIAATRGAAASLLRLDFGAGKLQYCGIGNCHLHTLASPPIHPVSLPGIVGHRLRKVTQFEFDLPERLLAVLCSDGIASRLRLEPYEALTAQQVADGVLAQYGKTHDDATVAVVRLEPEQ